ncbi:S41 family peptidase [Patescibacteria group bacterium]|nr:S41 family peptidase [Patescibacteria group bacterium]
MSKRTSVFKIILFLLLFAGAFFLGSAYVGIGHKQDGSVSFDDVLLTEPNLFENVWEVVEANYLGEIDKKEILYGIIDGMVAGLNDPYSEFFDPEEAASFWEDMDGKYVGIGVEMTLKDGQVVILSVIENSPAKQADLKPGDIILAVDDHDVAGETLGEIASEIKGEEDTPVKITILRDQELKEFVLTRSKVVADSVFVNVDEDILAIGIYRFDDDTDRELVDKLALVDLNSIRGIIVDVRSNPGGYFDSAIKVADLFLADGMIVEERSSTVPSEKYYAVGGDALEEIALVVLINEFSASASEILAGAIKDNNRGQIVGQKSYGKGSVQIVEQLSGGAVLKLTVAEWLTPMGVNLRMEGIIPDVEVVNDEVDVDLQYEKAKEILINNDKHL